jgi:ATP-binding cassette subfamily F protein 3
MVDKGQVDVFDGDLDDYKNYILNRTVPNSKAKSKPVTKSINHENIKKTKKLKSNITSIEKRLARLNRKLSKANEDLADPELYTSDVKPDIQNLIKTQLELTSEIEIAEKEWLIASSRMDKLSS